MMEYFASGSSYPPLAECLDRVRDTDLVITLVAHRYGWVPPDQTPGQGKSVTWLECEAAVAHGAELAKFKHWLRDRRLTARFTTREDARGKAFHALTEWRRRHPEFAAVQPDDVAAAKGPANPEGYLRTLLGQSAFLDIRGLATGTARAHRFSIEDLYISLTTHYAAEEPRQPDGKRGPKNKKRRPAEDKSLALHESSQEVPLQRTLAERRVVIVGDPGAGKTTFLRRIATALCQTELGEPANAAPSRLGIKDRTFPLFLRAGELAAHICQQRAAAGAPATDDSPAWIAHPLAAKCSRIPARFPAVATTR